MTSEPLRAIDVAHAALMEAGRPDLAESIIGFDDDDGFGFYLEVNLDILDRTPTDDDLTLIVKAENLARMSVGMPTIERENP